MDIEKFLEDNRLKKSALAAYLGIVPSSISEFIRKGALPQKHVERIRDNSFGWDISAILDSERPPKVESILLDAIKTLQNECELLRGVIDRQEAIIARYEGIMTRFLDCYGGENG